MNSSKPVLILGKGITGESFREYFSKKKQPFITYDTRVKKQSFNLKKNLNFNFVAEEEIDFDLAGSLSLKKSVVLINFKETK